MGGYPRPPNREAAAKPWAPRINGLCLGAGMQQASRRSAAPTSGRLTLRGIAPVDAKEAAEACPAVTRPLVVVPPTPKCYAEHFLAF